jgi:hypothetical protein
MHLFYVHVGGGFGEEPRGARVPPPPFDKKIEKDVSTTPDLMASRMSAILNFTCGHTLF